MYCNTCKDRQGQEFVSRWTHESDMARMERCNRRLLIALVLMTALFAISNVVWYAYEDSFTEQITETYTSEADDGGTAIVNRDGDVHYGESDLHKND